jgi:hypothetical protein
MQRAFESPPTQLTVNQAAGVTVNAAAAAAVQPAEAGLDMPAHTLGGASSTTGVSCTRLRLGAATPV